MRVFLLENDLFPFYPISEKEKRYLFKVLRLSLESSFDAKDKNGNYYKASFLDENTLTLTHTNPPLISSLPEITMAIALLKGKKTETVIRMLTEIGVKKIILTETRYTVKEKRRLDRYPLIIREAVQQSGSTPPVLIGPVSLEEALGEGGEVKLFFHQDKTEESVFLNSSLVEGKKSVIAYIGPEGGFSDEEYSFSLKKGALPVVLKTNILRGETAAVYVSSTLQAFLNNS